MISVRPARECEVDQIICFLRREFVPHLMPEKLRGLFDYRWTEEQDKPNLGFVMVSGAEIVGFLGAVYATRRLANCIVKTCNLSTWYVRPDYRHGGMKLLYAVLELKDYSITNFTASPRVRKVMESLGFHTIDRVKRVFLPWHVSKSLLSRVDGLTSDPSEIAQYLGCADALYLNDHLRYRIIHYFFRDEAECCYIILKRRMFPGPAAFGWIPVEKIRRMWYPCAEVLYISNPLLAVDHWNGVVASVIRREGVLGVVAPERLFNGHPPYGGSGFEHYNYLLQRQTVSATVDSLYSEYTVLPI